MGKTTLALIHAAALAEKYPGGVVLLDFKEVTPHIGFIYDLKPLNASKLFDEIEREQLIGESFQNYLSKKYGIWILPGIGINDFGFFSEIHFNSIINAAKENFKHDQKDAIKQSFQGLSFNVSVDEGAEKRITFKEVYVFPQGIGALLSGSPIPKRGLIGVIDIGYHTTDYLLIEASDAGVQPLSSYMSSTQQGMHTAQTLFADAFRQETGRPITLNEARSMWDKDAIAFAGNKIDLITLKQEAKQETGRVIAENILAAWSDKIDFLDGLFLAGGAAIELLPVLKNYLTNPVLLDDSQFANANGFYQMANWSINKKQNLKAKTIN